MKKTRDKAAASAGAADLLYERFEGRIRARFADPDVARDVVTLGGMTEIYCADHHPESMRMPYRGLSTDMGLYPARRIPRLCPACAAHLRYGEARRALCTREPRPSCKTCAVHCYTPEERAWQQESMAYAGPRAIFRGQARNAIRPLLQTRLS